MPVNVRQVLIFAAVVLLTLRFRAQLLGVVGRIPVVGGLVGT